MNRTLTHLLLALCWLAVFTLAITVAVQTANPDEGHMRFYARVGSLIWALGFVAIFFSWARKDAPAHGRSIRSAVVFAVARPFFNIFAHVVYLFFTRGMREGLLASLKFACFLLAACMAWFMFVRVLPTNW